MRNVDIYIPSKAFRYLMNNTESRDAFSKGNPLYVVYYRHKNGSLGHAVLDIANLTTFAGQCVFKSKKDRKEFIEYFIPSLRSQISESNKTNYRWRLGTYYEFTEYSWRVK